MTILVVGASGATGRQLVEQLLTHGHTVRVIVRSSAAVPTAWQQNRRISIIHARIADVGVADLVAYTTGCQAVASCLGHRLSWQGIYGQPRKLVTQAVRALCTAIKTHSSRPGNPVKFILMNTAGNRNHDLPEPISIGHRLVVGLIRLLLPPHVDNEQAANYLRTEIGQHDSAIEWVAVRPDSLTNEEQVSAYEVFPSPTRSPFFNAGKTSRINVAHFMVELITKKDTWNRWQGRMPIVYNKSG